MRLIRSKGRSQTDFQSSGALRRNLLLTRRDERDGHDDLITDLPAYASSDPLLLIRQFISVIDKILRKPKDIKQMSEDWYLARDRLGTACWKLMVDRHLDDVDAAQLVGTWRWKLHPYAASKDMDGDLQRIAREVATKRAASKKNGKDYHPPKFNGRWHKVFWPDERPGDGIDFDGIAERISDHLLNTELTINGTPRKSGQEADITGLIVARAESIQKSVFKDLAVQSSPCGPKPWGKEEEDRYCQPDVVKAIMKTARDLEQKRQRITTAHVGKSLFEHYETIGMANPDTDIAPESRDKVHALHDAVKAFYKSRIRNSKRGEKGHQGKKLSASLPHDFTQLLVLLGQKRGNSQVNDLVRHGKNIFFARSAVQKASTDAGFEEELRAARQHFWTSEGQAQIKRSEAFTRVWRNVVSQAARTAKSWADPDGDLVETSKGYANDDILGSALIKLVTADQFDSQTYDAKLDVLFGNRADIFRPTVEGDQKNLFKAALTIAAKIRTGAVHFSSRDSFVATLKKSISTITEGTAASEKDQRFTAETQERITSLITVDAKDRVARLITDLSGLGIQNFTDKPTASAFVTSVANRKESDLAIPRFNRVLDRHDGTREVAEALNDDRINLPSRASTLELTDPASLCKFGCMKVVYERVFSSWLTELPPSDINAAIDAVLVEGAARARLPQAKTNPYRDQIRAKANNLPPVDNGGLIGLFNDLAHEIATELRQQNAYEPNPETARDQSGWIEDFKCDLLGLLFPKFLRKNGYGWLLDLKAEAEPNRQPCELPDDIGGDTGTFATWEANLYLFLHLVPVDDVARLIHQLRKTAVLEGKSVDGADEEAAPVKRLQMILSLYMDMHNAKFTGDAVNVGLSEFRNLFERPDDFKDIYNEGDDQDHLVMNTRRGLRQIMRFGHLRVVEEAFAANKVSGDDVKAVQAAGRLKPDGVSQIEADQKERQDLHDKLSKLGRERASKKQFDRYSDLVRTISDHRQRASRVRLTDHVRVHQIIMRVMARLIDFAGVWERDRFLVFLALIDGQRARGEAGMKNIPTTYPKANELKSRSFDVGFLTDANRILFEKYFGDDAKNIRNDLAHFNVLAADRLPLDLTTEINRVRKMMSYDRKLKNSVTKSIIELVAREGIGLSWSVKDHLMVSPTLKPRQIEHLKSVNVEGLNRRQKDGPKITETFHSPALTNMVLQAFGGQGVKAKPSGYLSGTVKFMNDQKGFGFIIRDDGKGDVFVHVSEVNKAGVIEMSQEKAIWFKLGKGRNGKECAVELIDPLDG